MNFVYKSLQNLKNPAFFKTFNKVTLVNNYDQILPKLFLGNIEASKDIQFFKNNNIQAIVNCTENEPFHEYFENDSSKYKLRIDVKDSRETENIQLFYSKIDDAVSFIDDQINNKNNTVFIHCYWGFMRSATIVACYLIKRYSFSPNEAIQYIKDNRSMALNKFYNFNDIIQLYHNEQLKKINQ